MPTTYVKNVTGPLAVARRIAGRIVVRQGENTAAAAASALASAASAAAATASAAAAEAAASVFTFEMGVEASGESGVEAGLYQFGYAIPRDFEVTRFYARVLDGSGSASVSVLDDLLPVIGPVTINATATTSTPTLTFASGSDLHVVVNGTTGTVNALVVKVEGRQA